MFRFTYVYMSVCVWQTNNGWTYFDILALTSVHRESEIPCYANWSTRSFHNGNRTAAYSKFRRNFPIFISFLFYYSTDSDSNADRNPFFFISFSFVLFFYSRHRPGGREHGERERERNLYCHCHRFSVFVLTNIEQWWALSLNVIWPEYIKLCPTVFVFSPLSLAHLNEFSTYRTHTGDWLFELLLYTLQIYSCETCW